MCNTGERGGEGLSVLAVIARRWWLTIDSFTHTIRATDEPAPLSPARGYEVVEVVPAEQLRGAVHLNATLGCALADALSEDPMRVMRAGRVLRMIEDQDSPPGGGQS